MKTVCDKKDCMGCGLCKNICPKKAISFEPLDNDFLYPVINQSLCVDCGKCVDLCPNNQKLKKNKFEKVVYGAWSKDKENRKTATSGGIFKELSNSVIKNGGVVAGVVWDNTHKAIHRIVDDEEDLYLFSGSKYVQSDTNDIFIQVKKHLDEGRTVLFSGTPCQVHAMSVFLNNRYKNIILVDLVCHGVPSQKMFEKYLLEQKSKYNSNIIKIEFRKKSPYWDFSKVNIQFENGSVYSNYTVDDTYFNLFNVGYSLRDSCHNCRYTNLDRQSDITLSDFWDFRPKKFKMRNYNYGVSCVIVNTQKGKDTVESILDNCVYDVSTLEEAKVSNKSLSEPYQVPIDKLNSFWTDYDSGMSVFDLDKKYTHNCFTIPKRQIYLRFRRKYNWLTNIVKSSIKKG